MRLYTSFHLFAGLGLLAWTFRARRLTHKLPATLMLAQLGMQCFFCEKTSSGGDDVFWQVFMRYHYRV